MSDIKLTVGDLCHFDNGYGFKPSDWKEQGLPIIRIQNLNGSDKFNYFTGKPKDSWTVETGDLLFAWAGVRGVSFGPTIWKGQKGVLNQHIYRIRPKKEVNIYWLYSALKIITTRIEAKAHGFKSSLLHVHKRDITEQVIPVPPIEEQQKIAAILGDWDHTIDKLEQLLTAKRTYKHGLMQQLLSGKTRFPAFIKSNEKQKTRYSECPKDWKYLTFGDIATEYNQKNKKHEQHTVLSCTKHRGLVDSLEYFGKQVFSKDTSTYKLVERSMFAYATNHIDEGSIGYQDLTETALISPMYTVFNTDKSQVDDEYLFAVLKTETYRQIFAANTNASVDRRGSLRWKDFSKIHLALPSFEEQRKIAAVLQAADAEITALEQQLKAFRQQKRGLMQQLLTGKKRVKTNKQSL